MNRLLGVCSLAAGALVIIIASADLVGAQGIEIRGAITNNPAATPGPGRNKAARPAQARRATLPAGQSGVQLVAFLTDSAAKENGAQIEDGLLWRIYSIQVARGSQPKLVLKNRAASPVIRLSPGQYFVHAAYGKAYITRRITVPPKQLITEKFVLNAGGLRVTPIVTSTRPIPLSAISYDVFNDERDQLEGQSKVVSGARPGAIVRLNSGLYRIVSRYGKANATVEARVTVEPGKLTDAKVKHLGAPVSFKLVARPGGEAIASTQWTIQTAGGRVVVKSAGALPRHILAPGKYAVVARSRGRVFRKVFAVENGKDLTVELLNQ